MAEKHYHSCFIRSYSCTNTNEVYKILGLRVDFPELKTRSGETTEREKAAEINTIKEKGS
jgi:hypothetical protein